MPESRTLGPSAHQMGPSPSQTWVGVHSKVCPRGMTGTSAMASWGQIAKIANPRMNVGIRNCWMAEVLPCDARYLY